MCWLLQNLLPFSPYWEYPESLSRLSSGASDVSRAVYWIHTVWLINFSFYCEVSIDPVIFFLCSLIYCMFFFSSTEVCLLGCPHGKME